MKYLNNDLIKNIFEYVYPTKIQMANWKIEHYINNYYKVLQDIEDIIIEVKIENGKKKEVFSLFSLSLLESVFDMDSYSYSDDEY